MGGWEHKLKSATVSHSNEVKKLGHKRKVDLLPIRTVADLIFAGCEQTRLNNRHKIKTVSDQTPFSLPDNTLMTPPTVTHTKHDTRSAA